MFFRESQTYNRATILQREITSFSSKEETLLKSVENKNIIKLDLLPTADTVCDLYSKSGISEQKSKLIADNYKIKQDLLRDYQKGLTISFYHENQTLQQECHDSGQHKLSCIVISGLPGAGKTKQAKIQADKLAEEGKVSCQAISLYKGNPEFDSFFYINKEKMIENAIEINQNVNRRDQYTIISANEIREEYPDEDNDFVFAMIEARMAGALCSGCSVILDAANLEAQHRDQYMQMAQQYNATDIQIVLCEIPLSQSANAHPEIPKPKLENMQRQYKNANQCLSEYWKVTRIQPGEKHEICDTKSNRKQCFH